MYQGMLSAPTLYLTNDVGRTEPTLCYINDCDIPHSTLAGARHITTAAQQKPVNLYLFTLLPGIHRAPGALDAGQHIHIYAFSPSLLR